MKNEIPQETLDWLNEQNAIDVSSYKYFLIRGNMHYTEDYLKNTPLKKIKEGYQRHLKQLGSKG